MSITKELADKFKDKPAVLCCRFEAGTEIQPENLEDPEIFDDLIDTGLLDIPENALKIGQVLGATLKETADSLTPLTEAILDNLQEPQVEEVVEEEAQPVEAVAQQAAPVAQEATGAAGFAHIHIGEGKDIDLTIQFAGNGVAGGQAGQPMMAAGAPAVAGAAEPALGEESVLRSFTRKYFKVTEVKRGPETKLEGTVLTIREGIEDEACGTQELVKKMEIEIITPDNYGAYSNSIMDVQPIETKEEGGLGEGVTRALKGAVLILTGTDEGGVQIGEFGSSEGEMDRNIMFNRPGSPDKGEILIKVDSVLQAKTNMERRGPMSVHRAVDLITQEIRNALKAADESLVVEEQTFEQKRRPGRKRVLLVKEIMGQGAMHDNFILPAEPCGCAGARANVDLGNVPVVLSPLEILDGGVHALTCIGPASKETSRHYAREPLVLEALNDPEIEVIDVMLVGSPQANTEKTYVSQRLGMTVEAINPDGVIITTEGFGNNHVDFCEHHEEVGKRGIPVVGMSFCAVQGALVTGNPYMVAMVDNNKSRQGIENEVLENNCLAPEDAVRSLAMLKTLMAGGEIKEAERHYNVNVKLNNIDLIEKATGRKVELVPNETTLEMSKKRREIYEKDEASK